MIRKALFFLLILPLPLALMAADDESVKSSTHPIGSAFYRHLAYDFNVDLRDLYKFERRGFGRAEIITLVMISKSSGTVLKELGKRRLKADTALKTMAAEAGLDYDTLYRVVRVIKEGIEAKGDNNLPPPVLENEQAKEREKQDSSGSHPDQPMGEGPPPIEGDPPTPVTEID